MADFWDTVRERAASKPGFDPRLTGPAPQLRPAASFNPRAVQLPPRVSNGMPPAPQPVAPPVGVPDPNRVAAIMQLVNESKDSGSSVLGQVGGVANRVFSGLIDAVDTPGAVVRYGIAKGLEYLPESLKDEGYQPETRSFVEAVRGDAWPWQANANYGAGNMRFSDVSKSIGAFDDDSGLGKWGNAAVNFVGDIASDPLTFGAGSTVRATAAGGASVLDNALAAGSRKGLATTVAEQAAKRGVADDAVKLIEQAGQRGRGAFTRQGLKRAGYTEEAGQKLLKDLGLNSRFGYGWGYGGRKVYIPGTRRAAEAAENLKGAAKIGIASSKAAGKARAIFSESNDAVISAERQFINDIVSGSDNAADAARGLVTIMKGRAVAYPWMDAQSNNVIKKMGKQLEGLSDEDAISIANMVETGQAAEGTLARQVQDWYQEIGAELQSDGIEFGWVDNYINHRLTPKARKEVLKGRNSALREAGLDAAQPFQMTRELKVTDTFLGESIPDVVEGQKYWTINQINEVSQRQLGYKLLEDDVRELMGFYLEQAGKAKLHREIYKATDEVGLNVADRAKTAATEKLAEMEQQAYEMLQQGQQVRRQGLNRAAQEAGDAKRAVAQQLELVENEMKSRLDKLDSLNERRTLLNKELVDKQSQIKMWEDTVEGATKGAKRSRTTTKGNLTRKVQKLQAEVEDIQRKIAENNAQLGRAERLQQEAPFLEERAAALRDQLIEATENQRAAELARGAMDSPGALAVPDAVTPDTAGDVVAQAVSDMNRVAAVRQEFTEATKEYFDAAAAVVWQTTDDAAKRIRLEAKMDVLDDIIAKADSGNVSDVTHAMQVSELKARMEIVHEALQDEGLDAAARAVRDAEAQALAYDAAAGLKEIQAGEYSKRIFDSMGNIKWQENMQEVLGSGFRAIDTNIAVPTWYDEAFQRIPKTQEEWGRLRTVIEKYDAAMNIWKGWATTSPGFVFRNMYSGFFNMYLDDVSAVNVKRFQGFIHAYHQPTKIRNAVAGRDYGLENAIKWARKKGYSEIEIQQFQDALAAASVSGWGLTPQEVSSGLLDQRSWNPFSTGFRPTAAIRGQSTNVEGLLRGAHAYDKIVKGADVAGAVQRVEKFHFNYRDITDFDRMAKRVIPFWTFYSRNMVLQAEMWARYPQKLNRSYYNMKRNLEAQSDPDQVVPGYYDELGAVRTPFGERDGGTVYFTPDLPSLRFRDDFAKLTGTDEEGFDPLRLLSDAAPAFKVPVEQIGGKRLFTGNNFNNRLYEYDSNGNRVGREANYLLQLPGIKQAADIAFGGGAEVVNGKLLMNDKAEAAMEDILPVVGRMNRLVPSTEKQKERWGQNVASFFGAPGRVNSPQAIQGELYGRNREREDRIRAEAERRLLEEITR